MLENIPELQQASEIILQ